MTRRSFLRLLGLAPAVPLARKLPVANDALRQIAGAYDPDKARINPSWESAGYEVDFAFPPGVMDDAEWLRRLPDYRGIRFALDSDPMRFDFSEGGSGSP